MPKKAIPSAAGEEGRLSMSDLSSLTNIPQHRLEFFFSGGVALRTDEELAVMQILHREHERNELLGTTQSLLQEGKK